MTFLDRLVVATMITGAITLIALSIWSVAMFVSYALDTKQQPAPSPTLVYMEVVDA